MVDFHLQVVRNKGTSEKPDLHIVLEDVVRTGRSDLRTVAQERLTNHPLQLGDRVTLRVLCEDGVSSRWFVTLT